MEEKSYNGQKVFCENCKTPSTITEYDKEGGFYDYEECDNCKARIKDTFWNCYYEIICEKCGRKVIILTQPDNSPEYYSKIKIKCECGEFISFSLPVN